MTNELPPLTGSDKQIAWANQIRTGIIAELTDFVATFDARIAKIQARAAAAPATSPTNYAKMEADRREEMRLIERGLPHLLTETDAGWWIDNRNTTALGMAIRAYDAYVRSR